MENYIYGLIDPRTDEVRYVGKTYTLERRVKEHLSEPSLKKHTKKNAWIKQLLKLGLSPEVVILEVCGEDWEDRERFWITQFSNLTNGTEGGIGSKGHEVSEETRGTMAERNRKVWTGRTHSEESKAKMSAAKQGRKLSEETRLKMSETQKNRPHIYTAKTYIVTFPDGHEETIFNLSHFCREYDLQRQVMDSVSKGIQKSHKGFKVRPYENIQ